MPLIKISFVSLAAKSKEKTLPPTISAAITFLGTCPITVLVPSPPTIVKFDDALTLVKSKVSSPSSP